MFPLCGMRSQVADALVKKKPLVPTAEEDFAEDTPRA